MRVGICPFTFHRSDCAESEPVSPHLAQMEEGEERGVVVLPENEPEATKRKILDFLNSHTAYELIPGERDAMASILAAPCASQ